MTLYAKPPLTLLDQVRHLQAKGLNVPDPAHAQRVLARLGLYRFKGYLLPFKSPTGYLPGLAFADVERLIDLDDRVRLHVLRAVQVVEVGVRQLINEHMQYTHGIRWYADPMLFKPDSGDFQHAAFVARAVTGFHKTPELFVGHYRARYDVRAHPPGWMIAETMTLGAWSKLFAAIADQNDRDAIAAPLPVRASTLQNWLHALTVLRNACAHQSRVYDRLFKTHRVHDNSVVERNLRTRSFHPADPQALRLAPRLYALHALTQALAPGHPWTAELKALVGYYAGTELPRLGFRSGWDAQPEWT